MLYTALFFGLISSLHCIGMCGPIAMLLPVNQKNTAKKVIQILVYHFGRLTAYGTIGFLFGLLGRGFFLAGIQQKFSIAIGVGIILLVIIPEKKMANYNFSKPIHKMIAFVKQKLGAQFKDKSLKSFYTIGVLNGFLPCGMIYVALFGAMGMQSPQIGFLYMFLFGLGTIPLMSFVVYFKTFFSINTKNKIQKAVPYLAILIGFLFILRGLGLGIPYVSPSTTSLFIQNIPNCN